MLDHNTDVEPYRWMFETYNNEHKPDEIVGHRAWLFKDLREAYEDLRETANTYKKKTLVDYKRIRGGVHASTGMLQYLGSWRQPDRYTSCVSVNWVNHRGRWAPKYSDAAVECPCGAIKYFTENRMAGEKFDEPHTDDCTRIDYHRTNMVIWQRRKRILHQTAWNHLPQARAAERMGLSSEAVSSQCQLLDIDYEALQNHGYHKWRATMLTLKEKFDFSNRDLVSVFGHARSTIRSHLAKSLDIYDEPHTRPTHTTGVTSDD